MHILFITNSQRPPLFIITQKRPSEYVFRTGSVNNQKGNGNNKNEYEESRVKPSRRRANDDRWTDRPDFYSCADPRAEIMSRSGADAYMSAVHARRGLSALRCVCARGYDGDGWM